MTKHHQPLEFRVAEVKIRTVGKTQEIPNQSNLKMT